MKQTLKSRLLEHLNKAGCWMNGAVYERKAMDIGYKGSTASRQLRLLAEEGKIERKEMRSSTGKKSVYYRSLKPKKKVAIFVIINGVKEFKGYTYE
jgi:DNA-binding transcriptional ArsR family regulator